MVTMQFRLLNSPDEIHRLEVYGFRCQYVFGKMCLGYWLTADSEVSFTDEIVEVGTL